MNTSSPKERAQKRQDRRTGAPANSGPCLFSESILQVLATFVFVSGSHGFIHLDGVCFKTNQMNDGHCPIDEQALFDEQMMVADERVQFRTCQTQQCAFQR